MGKILGAVFNLNTKDNTGEDELYKYSRFLRKVAWGIEIIVVFIGLCISLSLATSGGDDLISAFVLAAPFVMISLVELTKIPFVNGMWNSKKSFPLYVIVVLFLALITFENLFNGFERAFSSISNQIKKSEIEISRVENKIKANEDNIKLTLQEFNTETEKIASSRSRINSNYKARYKNAVKRNERLSKNVPELQSALSTARNDLNKLKGEKTALLREMSVKKEELFKSSMKNTEGRAEEIKAERTRLLGEITALREEKKQAVDDASFLTSDMVKKEYDDKIRYVENQLNTLNNKTMTGQSKKPDMEQVKFLDDYYAELLTLKDDMIKNKTAEVTALQNRHNEAVAASSQNLVKVQRRLYTQRQNSLGNLEKKLALLNQSFSAENDYIKTLKQENTKLRYEIRMIEVEANTKALSNQVYRIASYVDNVTHYKEIKPETLTLVGLVWFGSLALIGSFIGIALTLAGLHLEKLAEKRQKKVKSAGNRFEQGIAEREIG